MKLLFYVRGRESIGVGYLMSAVRAAGHEARLLFDPGFEDNLFQRASILRGLNRWKRGLREASRYGPDWVGLTCLTNQLPHVLRAARELKQATGARILLGGPHASLRAEQLLEHPFVDAVAIGEAEESLPDLLRRMQEDEDWRRTPGFVVRTETGILRNPIRPPPVDLESLCPPDRISFRRAGAFGRVMEAASGRGCAHRCTFCINSVYRQIFGPHGSVRRKSPEFFLRELREYRRRFRPLQFLFHDEDFLSHKGWLREFAPGYRRRVDLPFFCLSHPASVDVESVRLLAHAGCREIFLGLDSGDEQIRRDVLQRPVAQDKIREACRMIRAAGIRLQVSAMFLVPGEDLAAMSRTVSLVHQVRPDSVATFLFYPFPGFPLTRRATEMGLLEGENLDERVGRDARCSYHRASLLNHPCQREGENLAHLLPFWHRLGADPRRLMRWTQRLDPRWSRWLYVLSLPWTQPLMARINLEYLGRMGLHAMRPFRSGVTA